MDQQIPKAEVCYLCGAVVQLEEVTDMREKTASECLTLEHIKYTRVCEDILALSDIQNICTVCFVRMYKKMISGYEFIFVSIKNEQTFLKAEAQIKQEEELIKGASVIGSQIPISSAIKEQPAMYNVLELDEQERIVSSKWTFDQLVAQIKVADEINERQSQKSVDLKTDRFDRTTDNNVKGYNNVKRSSNEEDFENTDIDKFDRKIFVIISWFVCMVLIFIMVVSAYAFPWTILMTILVSSGLLITSILGLITYVKIRFKVSVAESAKRCGYIFHSILQGLKETLIRLVKKHNFKQHIMNMLDVAWGCKI